MLRFRCYRYSPSGYLKISESHTWWGDAFGTLAWLWVFHRFHQDGAVLLGFRHPWEHDGDHGGHDDDHDDHGAVLSVADKIDKFNARASIQKEVDDDDEDEEEEEE
jgi:hypothetical protein